MTHGELEQTLLDLIRTQKETAKTVGRLARTQNAMLESLTELHMSVADVLEITIKLKKLKIEEDLEKQSVLVADADRMMSEVYDGLLKSLTILRDRIDGLNEGEAKE